MSFSLAILLMLANCAGPSEGQSIPPERAVAAPIPARKPLLPKYKAIDRRLEEIQDTVRRLQDKLPRMD